jgi:hypothetical protein
MVWFIVSEQIFGHYSIKYILRHVKIFNEQSNEQQDVFFLGTIACFQKEAIVDNKAFTLLEYS